MAAILYASIEASTAVGRPALSEISASVAKPERRPPPQRVAGALARGREPVARRRRVVAHAQHPLALEHDRLGPADALQHDHPRARGIQGRAVAGHEPAHALHERLLGARGEQDHAHVRDRLGAKGPRELEQHGDGGEVVVGAGHDARGRRSRPTTSAASSAAAPPARRSRRRPSSAPAPASSGPATTSCISGGEVSWRPYQSGNVSATSRVGPGWKMRPALAASWWATKIDGLSRVRVAQLADHVGGHPARQRGAAEPVGAARDVVGDPGGRGQAGEPGHARGRGGSDPAAAPIAASSATGTGKLPVAGSSSSRAADALGRQRVADPLGRRPLPRRGRRPVDRLQGLDGGEQAVAVGRGHRRGAYERRPRPAARLP